MGPPRKQICLFLLLRCLQYAIGSEDESPNVEASSTELRIPNIRPSSGIDFERRETNVGPQNQVPQFPRHLDVKELQNMPLVILQPRRPVQLELLSGDHIANLQRALRTANVQQLVKNNYEADSETNQKYVYRPKDEESRTQPESSNVEKFPSPEASLSKDFEQLKISKYGMATPAFMEHRRIPHSSWMDKLMVSFSHMLPRRRPAHSPSVFYPASSNSRPVFGPGFSRFMNPLNSPVVASPSLTYPTPFVWNRIPYASPFVDGPELAPVASDRLPVPAAYPDIGYRPIIRPYLGVAPHGTMNFYDGADLFASGSQPVPAKLPPPKGFRLTRKLFARPSRNVPRYFVPPSHVFANYVSKFPKHRPLFNSVEGLGATSLEIGNAFADFADSHEHGPEVTQKFGSVGDSINKFLRVMGLGVAGISSPDIGPFGGGGEYASMESAPIARSMDFYPGYGNQAHLDHFDDMEIFEQDITDLFNQKFRRPTESPVKEKKNQEMMTPSVVSTTSTTKRPKPTRKTTEATPMMDHTSVPQYTEMVSPQKADKETSDAEERKMPKQKVAPMKMDAKGMDQSAVTMPTVKMTKEGMAMSKQPLTTPDMSMKEGPANSPMIPSTTRLPTVHSMRGQVSGFHYAPAVTMEEKKNRQVNPEMHNSPMGQVPREKDVISHSSHPSLPAVNYRLPPTYPTAAPEDHRQPILIYQNIPPPIRIYHKTPPTENPQVENRTSYAPAHSLPNNHRSVGAYRLMNDESARRWIPVTTIKEKSEPLGE